MKKVILALGLVIAIVLIGFVLMGQMAPTREMNSSPVNYKIETIDGQKFLVVTWFRAGMISVAVAAFPK